jgi:hypothetical protein
LSADAGRVDGTYPSPAVRGYHLFHLKLRGLNTFSAVIRNPIMENLCVLQRNQLNQWGDIEAFLAQ